MHKYKLYTFSFINIYNSKGIKIVNLFFLNPAIYFHSIACCVALFSSSSIAEQNHRYH